MTDLFMTNLLVAARMLNIFPHLMDNGGGSVTVQILKISKLIGEWQRKMWEVCRNLDQLESLIFFYFLESV